MDGDSWLSWIPIVFLLCMAAYFAVAETAATSVSRIRLKTRLDQGDQKAKRALYVQDNFDRAISAILIGTNIVHISTATLTTVLVTRTWGASWVALGTIVCTIAVFFAGEMLPKSIAKRYSERCALATAPSLCFFMRIFAPLAKALSHIGEFFSNLAKGEPEITVTEDELYDIIETMTDEGELPEDRAELVHSALEFADVTVERVFTPRVDVAALDVNTPPEKILSFIREQRHSRLPVYEGSIDNIIGVVHEKDFYLARLKKTATLEDLIAPTLYTTGSTQISQLLRTLREQHHHMAVVVDEYGGTEGIITLEDILEELVGEIWDEHDEATEDFRQQSDGSWLVSGSASVDDLYETLDLPEDEDIDSNTVNGLVQEKTHHLPKVGDHFQLNDYEGVVTRTARRRVTEVRFTHTAPAPQDDEKDKDKRFSRLSQRTEGR